MLKSKTPLLVVQNIFNSLFGLVGVFFITRFYPVSWGILSFAIGFVGLFSFLSDLGYSTAYVRFLSSGMDEGKANSNILAIKMVLGAIFAAVTFAALFFWTDILHRGFEFAIDYWVIIGLIPYYFFVSLGSFPQSYFRSKISSAKYVIPLMADAAIRNSIFIVMGIVAIINVNYLSDASAAILLSLSYDVSYFFYFYFSYRFGRPWKFSGVDLETIKKYTQIAIPLAIAGVVGSINTNIDKIIIQFFWGDFATGGFYLDQKLALVISSFGGVLTVFFLPILSKLHSSSDSSDLNQTTNEFERLVIIFILPLVIMTFFLSYYIVRIFSALFTPYSDILSILSVSAIFTVLVTASSSALIAKGKARIVGSLSILSMTVNIILNFILIPQEIFGIRYLSIGPLGGGVSSLVASIIYYLGLRIFLTRTSGIKFAGRTFYPLLAGAVEALFLYYITRIVSPERIFILIPVMFGAGVIFTGTLLLTRQIEWSDLTAFIKNLLNPFHLTNTFREENK